MDNSSIIWLQDWILLCGVGALCTAFCIFGLWVGYCFGRRDQREGRPVLDFKGLWS